MRFYEPTLFIVHLLGRSTLTTGLCAEMTPSCQPQGDPSPFLVSPTLHPPPPQDQVAGPWDFSGRSPVVAVQKLDLKTRQVFSKAPGKSALETPLSLPGLAPASPVPSPLPSSLLLRWGNFPSPEAGCPPT